MAMYSDVVKQSCVSMPSIASTPGSPARFQADVIVERTWGSTYSLSLLSATLSAKRRRAVLWPQPMIVGISSMVIPRFAA